METLTDPVCGTQVEWEKAAGVVSYGGRLYYFCCGKCRSTFLHMPRRYCGAGTCAGEQHRTERGNPHGSGVLQRNQR